jgi:NADPH:quinone reductase
MKALQIDHFGTLENLQIRDVADAPLPQDSIRVEVEAAAVNPSDVGVALGKFPRATLPRILGRDFAGKVIEGRADLLGMPVWGSGGGELGMTRDGSHAEHLILPVSAAVRRPAHLCAEEAAAAGVPFVTAWSALVELAAVKPGELVLVAGAAGAVGSAAIELALALGARAIAVVLESDDLTSLKDLDLIAVLRSDRDDVPATVRQITGGRGVEIALNAVGAATFAPLFESLADGGRMVIFTARSGKDVKLDLFAFYRRQLRFFGLDTATFSLDEIVRLYGKFAPLFEARSVKPTPIAARLPLSRAHEAYERVDRGEQGKFVLIPGA